MLKAAVTKVDITPPQGLELEGYPHYPRHNTGAHDPLEATCMYINNGEEEIAMITLDLLYFSKQHVKVVRNTVEEKCGIKGNNIMITCTHTHSGPKAYGNSSIEDIESGRKQPMEYVNSVIDKIVGIVCEAKESAYPALFARGTEVCGAESGIGGNRVLKGGPHDPLVSVMAIKDMDNKIRGAIVNYSLHPTFIHEWSTLCTADFPCYVKKEVEETYPGALCGFAQGASGNQSSRYYRQGESYDEAERVGRTLGKAAAKVIDNAIWTDDLVIKTANRFIPIELIEFKPEEELEAEFLHDKAVYEELYAKYGKSEDRNEYLLWQNANLKHLGSENQLGYARMLNKGYRIERYEDENPAEVQIIRLGDTVVIGVPGEIFIEYSIYVKALSGFYMTVFNEVTNGCLPGYICTPEAKAKGGYEAGTSLIHEDFGRHLVDNILNAVKEVK